MEGGPSKYGKSVRNFLCPRSRKTRASQCPCDPSENEERGEGQIDTILRVALIWDKIASNLDIFDLKTCRLVNSTWNQFSVRSILKQDVAIVPFIFNTLTSSYVHDSPWKSIPFPDSPFLSRIKFKTRDIRPQKLLFELITCLNHFPSFPCSAFRFVGRNFEDIESQSFFALHGPLVKSLSLISGHTTGPNPPRFDGRIFHNLLSSQCPNIHTLELGFFWFSDAPKFEKKSLPFLKKIICEPKYTSKNYAAVILNLIEASPNLNCVENFNCNYTDKLLQLNKIGIVQKYEFWKAEKDFQKFGATNPRLSHLSCLHSDQISRETLEAKRNYENCLNLILKSSQGTLKFLKMEPMGFLNLKFPPLQNVQTLCLCKWSTHAGAFLETDENDEQQEIAKNLGIFPASLNLAATFPNLRTLKLNSCDMESLGTKGILVSVKNLTVYGLCTATSWRIVKDLVPNVNKIVIQPELSWSLLQQVRDIFEIFNGNEKLECLQINFERIWGCSIWDAAFLGVSEDKLDSEEDVDLNSKEFPSIHDMTNLREVRLVVANKYFDLETPQDFHFLTWRSGVHAFDQMDLKVTVGYHQHCPSASIIATALEPLTPWVTLTHEFHKMTRIRRLYIPD